MSHDHPLKGKVAAITGASSGIGKETAKALFSVGVKLSLGARRDNLLDDLKKELGADDQSIFVSKLDVTSRDQVKEWIAASEKHFNQPVDILINNAGIMPLSFMKNVHEDEWEQMVDVNIKGVLHGIGAVLPSMLKRKSGDIVNISSDAGRKVFPSGTVYCATKWAVEAITAGLRNEIAGNNVRLLSIQPGATKTDLASTSTDQECIENGKKFADAMKFLEPEDVAQSIVFALSQPRHASINEILIRPEQQGM